MSRRVNALSRFNTMRFVKPFLVLLLLSPIFSCPRQASAEGNYALVKKTVEGHLTYHLIDTSRKLDVGIVPDIGNFTYEFKMNGKDVLIPTDSLSHFLDKRWFCCGIPFLAPFANRIDKDYYYFQGKKYLLNDELGNVLRLPDTRLAIHGLLVFDPRWQVVASGAGEAEAYMTSRLEFYKYPDLMAQFPFACVMEMTYRLRDGKLENTTMVFNVGLSSLPVDIGFHPYFRPDGPREEWTLAIGAKKHWIVNKSLIPTGETEPTDKFLAGVTKGVTLGKTFIDDGFSDLERDADREAHIWVKGKTEKIEVIYGEGFDYAIVYAPLDNTLFCIEPQTGPTNAFNLNHEGKFPGLVVLDPGQVFKASFWIVPVGF